MIQATRYDQLTFSDYVERALREGAMWSLMCVAVYLAISLASYSPADPGWSYVGETSLVTNAGGRPGAWFADVALYLFGFFAYLLPLMVAWSAWLVFRGRGEEPALRIWLLSLRWIGFFVTLVAGCGYAALHLGTLGANLPNGAGGGFGLLVSRQMTEHINASGTNLLLGGMLLISASLFAGVPWLGVLEQLGAIVLQSARLFGSAVSRVAARRFVERRADAAETDARFDVGVSSGLPSELNLIDPPSAGASASSEPRSPGAPRRPPLDLLDTPRPSEDGDSEEQLEEFSHQVESALAEFGVEVRVVAVYPGPVVTLFELQPIPGLTASDMNERARDLARALSTVSVRVVEMIPGKAALGLEIPNQVRTTVFLRDIFASALYQTAPSPLTLGIGTNISGLPVIVDLARLPHALIAGTKGSGKSVAIHAMILSLLYKAGPEAVRLLLVAPNMLELSVYTGIPHLLTPLITDMPEATNALRWCVGEMERRYRLMAKLGVRNIGDYNRQIAEAEAAGVSIPDPTGGAENALDSGAIPALARLPYLVVIIDELADMLMTVGKQVEALIAHLAQKARASGIHLLLATQRPSEDVLTERIKANIPARLALQVSSRIDSRTVLDQAGAEQLLGHGDMLYLPPVGQIPQRVHGAFVDDHEIQRVVDFLKQQYGPPSYLDEILREPSAAPSGRDSEPCGAPEESDPLFDEAVQIVVESRRASVSGVQRRLKIDYRRAVCMIEAMERLGIVGPAELNGNRVVLAPPPERH